MKQLFYFFMVIVLWVVIPACKKDINALPAKPNLVGSWSGTYTLTSSPIVSSPGYTITSTVYGNVLVEVKGDNQTSSIKFSNSPILYIGAINIKEHSLTGKYYNLDSIPNIILENVSIGANDSTLNGILKTNINGSTGSFSVKKSNPGVIVVLR